MSYILDALKKAQEEKNRDLAARSRGFHLPVRRATPAASWLIFVSAAAALGAAVVAAVYLFTSGPNPAAMPKQTTPALIGARLLDAGAAPSPAPVKTATAEIKKHETIYPPVKPPVVVKTNETSVKTDKSGKADKSGKTELAGHSAPVLVAPARRPRRTTSFEGKVTGIIDGCLIEVRDADGPTRVTLRGVSCQDKDTPSGRAAKQFTASAVFLKTVRVEVTGQTADGTVEADVYSADGKKVHLNEALVSGGIAEAADAH
jgi:endonuclease YncB( thermonuclease family)